MARSKSYEVEWLADVDEIKSMRAILNHCSNCRRGRAGCNDLEFAGDTPAAAGTLEPQRAFSNKRPRKC